MNVNINFLTQELNRAKQEKEQSIARAISENDSKVVAVKYSEFEILCSDVVKNANIVKEQIIAKANEDYNRTITLANQTKQDKKVKFKEEQDNVIRINISSSYDTYINELEQLIKKHGGGQ